MAQFNHAYTIAFSVISNDPDGKDVTPAMLKEALLRRIAALDATTTPDWSEWLEACDAPYDTYEMLDDSYPEE
jgi:hypothetical protein